MSQVKRGDIVWLNEGSKIDLGENVQFLDRPYLIISNDLNNRYSPTINVASLSKNINKANYPMHVLLNRNKYNLDYDSIVLVEQIITVNKNRIDNKIASLDKEDLQKLDKAIFIQLIDAKVKNRELVMG